jgi:hypothetical protein
MMERSRYRNGQLSVSLSCFASAVFRFCDRTAAARAGVGRSSPGVVRLSLPRIAAAVFVESRRADAGSRLAGGALVVPLSGTVLRRRGRGVTSGETRVKGPP